MSSANTILIHEISKLTSKWEQWEPFTWYQQMREQQPVYYDAEQDVWNVFLYDHAKRVIFDHQLFSNIRDRSIIPVPRTNNRSNVNACDPPEHRKRRALLAQAFTPRTLEEWKPKIEAIVDDLIDDIATGNSTVDIVQKLAVPLPVTIIASLLGVPTQDRELIKAWSDILFYPYLKETFDDIVKKKQQALKEFHEYLYPIVVEKRKNPQNDIISDLTKAELHGEKLSDEEVVMSSSGLLGAGNETTTMLIANLFYSMLYDQPGIYQELKEEPALVPKLVEEVLRFRFPVVTDRQITQDTTVFGQEMKKGQIIIAWSGSANRDSAQFAHGDRFDIHRQNNRQHLTFGAGPHFCMGAPLARMKATIALTAFVSRFGNIQVPKETQIEDHLIHSAIGQSLKSLPIHIEPSS